MFVDIIVVNHNSTDCTIKCLKSVYQALNGIAAKIYIVDNASRDRPERIKNIFPDVRLISNLKNVGFSKAMNHAFSISDSPYVIMLNPDTVVTDNFFKETLEFIKTNQNIGILGPKIYNDDGTIQGSARKFPNFWTSIFGRKSPLTKLFPNNPITKNEFICYSCNGENAIDSDWVSGACMVINRKAVEEVKGFDERFFLYWEDTDICRRIKEKGWKIIYYRNACVVHLVGQSSSKKPLFSTLHFHRSCFYLFKKHAKWPLILMTPLVLWGLSIRAIFVVCLHLIGFIKKYNLDNDRKYYSKKDKRWEIEKKYFTSECKKNKNINIKNCSLIVVGDDEDRKKVSAGI